MNIGIIIPVFNAEKYLTRCLDSIIRQKYRNYACILIDDGSTDNSGVICDDYSKKYDNYFVIHTPNRGASVARNIGIDYFVKTGTCQFLTFIDADDEISCNYLSDLLKANIVNGTNISIAKHESISSTDSKHVDIPFNIDNSCNYDVLSSEDVVISNDLIYSPWGKLLHISLFVNTGFKFPEGVIFEDERSMYKLIFSVNRMSIVDKAIYYYYCNSGSVMNSAWTIDKYSDQLHSISEKFDFFFENKYYKALNKSFKFYCDLYVSFLNNDNIKKAFNKNSKNYLELIRLIQLYYDVISKEEKINYFDVFKRSKYEKKQYKNKIIKTRGICYYVLLSIKKKLLKFKRKIYKTTNY